MVETTAPVSHRVATSPLVRVLRLFIAIMTPVLLVLISVRLVMTPAWLAFEYQRPGFPRDFYGFTTEDRLRYAPIALDYLLGDHDISLLGDLRFESGVPLYTARELEHMVDVRVVTQAAFFVLAVGLIAFGLAAAYLASRAATRPELGRALRDGSVITLSLIAAIVLSAVIAWDAFFTLFHNLFFAEGTWQFLYSDTLIRLFPEQFWFDSALLIGGLTLAGALALWLAGQRLLARRD
ncbi:MAG: TIGR01906 family membrane protein [Chloroflexota bacterium]|nr:MAG: TIGR01906 family membrane protein [Chloroflexota bacterium]